MGPGLKSIWLAASKERPCTPAVHCDLLLSPVVFQSPLANQRKVSRLGIEKKFLKRNIQQALMQILLTTWNVTPTPAWRITVSLPSWHDFLTNINGTLVLWGISVTPITSEASEDIVCDQWGRPRLPAVNCSVRRAESSCCYDSPEFCVFQSPHLKLQLQS